MLLAQMPVEGQALSRQLRTALICARPTLDPALMHDVEQVSVVQLLMQVTISEQLVPLELPVGLVLVDVPPVLPMTGCVGFGPPSAPTEFADPMLLNTLPTVVPPRLSVAPFEQAVASVMASANRASVFRMAAR